MTGQGRGCRGWGEESGGKIKRMRPWLNSSHHNDPETRNLWRWRSCHPSSFLLLLSFSLLWNVLSALLHTDGVPPYSSFLWLSFLSSPPFHVADPPFPPTFFFFYFASFPSLALAFALFPSYPLKTKTAPLLRSFLFFIFPPSLLSFFCCGFVPGRLPLQTNPAPQRNEVDDTPWETLQFWNPDSTIEQWTTGKRTLPSIGN